MVAVCSKKVRIQGIRTFYLKMGFYDIFILAGELRLYSIVPLRWDK